MMTYTPTMMDPNTYIVLSCPECVFGAPLLVKTVLECILIVNRSQDVIELASFYTTSEHDDSPDKPVHPFYNNDGICIGFLTEGDMATYILTF